MVKRLRSDGFWVRGVDLVAHEFETSQADDFVIADLRDGALVGDLMDRPFDEIYQFAADMGGAGYVLTGDHDAQIMHNSAQINLNVLRTAQARGMTNVFFSSSACVYPQANQQDPDAPDCREDSVYPADPDSEYGWEKLFSERLYLAFNRQYAMNCRIGRYHNIFGPLGTWRGGREKVPAALCRKVAEAAEGEAIEVWGDGRQTRSFLYIDECLDATLRLMRSGCAEPVNIGSREMVSIDALARMIMEIAGKRLDIHHVDGAQGVRGRCSDNRLIREKLGWEPTAPLRCGLVPTYEWVAGQVARSRPEREPPAS